MVELVSCRSVLELIQEVLQAFPDLVPDVDRLYLTAQRGITDVAVQHFEKRRVHPRCIADRSLASRAEEEANLEPQLRGKGDFRVWPWYVELDLARACVLAVDRQGEEWPL